jgi:hypothetical protein
MGSKDYDKEGNNRHSRNSKEHANKTSAELSKESYAFIEGTVDCIGLPQIRISVSIFLNKMRGQFSNKYYVTELPAP